MGRAHERESTIKFVLWQKRRRGSRGLIVFLPVSEPAAVCEGSCQPHQNRTPHAILLGHGRLGPTCPSRGSMWCMLKWGGPSHCLFPQDQGGGRAFGGLCAWDPRAAEEISCLPVEARRGGVEAVSRCLSLWEESVDGMDSGAGS